MENFEKQEGYFFSCSVLRSGMSSTICAWICFLEFWKARKEVSAMRNWTRSISCRGGAVAFLVPYLDALQNDFARD